MATGSGAKRAAKDREVSLRKETEVQCGIVRLLYEDGSLSEKEYEDIVELLYAKEKGCSMQGTEDPAVEYLQVLA